VGLLTFKGIFGVELIRHLYASMRKNKTTIYSKKKPKKHKM
jgi:hypothetical protein